MRDRFDSAIYRFASDLEAAFAQGFSQGNRRRDVYELMPAAQTYRDVLVAARFNESRFNADFFTPAKNDFESILLLRSDDRRDAGPNDRSFLCGDLSQAVSQMFFMILRNRRDRDNFSARGGS